jgi:protein-disulfide isomerase
MQNQRPNGRGQNMKRLILAGLLLAGMAHAQQTPGQTGLGHSAIPSQSTGPSAFTSTQRAEIVQLLRDALRTDPSILRDAITALQQDDTRQQDEAARSAIASQHHALTAQPGDPTAGSANPDVTVVEFYDTRCPYCRRLLPTMAALLKADPKVRLVYKDLPILGAASVLEARALLAAQRQGGYLRLQDVVMHSTATPTAQTLRADAERLGLDGARFEQDMADPAIQARLDANLQLARALHIEGTPAFVIGAQLIPGAIELADMQQAVATARKP